ncbi:MAG TPA: serine/threonine-protein kinase [Phycisphaerales bacterium]|nr:serine/threonine-protein kinase [Phycisphaerales bacterium]
MNWHQYLHIDWQSPLGSGGEGCVFVARSITSGQQFAVKIPLAPLSILAQRQMIQEITRALRVTGNNVVRPLAWELAPYPIAIYELARYGSLRQEMNRFWQLRQTYHPVFALQRAFQMLLGVRDAHNSGIIHRDVKPENFLFFDNDMLKLSDFGVGRSISRPLASQTKAFVGTWNYASPEQMAGFGVDSRTDLYSVGVVLYEMLTGARPRVGTSYHRPSCYHANILPSLDKLCLRLMAVNKHNRPATVGLAIVEVARVWKEYMTYRQIYTSLGLKSPY